MKKILRGAIKIENRENLGQCPNRGGGRDQDISSSGQKFESTKIFCYLGNQ